MPFKHAVHTSAPTALLKLPAGQVVQLNVAASLLYLPAAQRRHPAPVDATTVRLTYDPNPHAVHALVPVVSVLYQPGRHAVHTCDVTATAAFMYCPALHTVHTKDVAAAATLL